MGHAIRQLKLKISELPHNITESEAKAAVDQFIDSYITNRIDMADKLIVDNGVKKIEKGDDILTYGRSSVVKMILIAAHTQGKQFRVIVVDSRLVL